MKAKIIEILADFDGSPKSADSVADEILKNIPVQIKTEEMLPPFHKEILFNTRDGVRLGKFYRGSHKFISGADKFHKSDVDCWMGVPNMKCNQNDL